jgi:hypothetical protein
MRAQPQQREGDVDTAKQQSPHDEMLGAHHRDSSVSTATSLHVFARLPEPTQAAQFAG